MVKNLEARFAAYADLVAELDDGALQEKLDIEKHKNIAEHLWCVIGARESYTKALLHGAWDGFSCSLNSFSKADFQSKLDESASALVTCLLYTSPSPRD